MSGDDLAVEFEMRGRMPDQAAIDWLKARGVEPIALVKTWRGAFDFVSVADVVFHVGRFEFEPRRADEAPVRSVLFLARDEERRPIDIVAWQPSEGYLAAWNNVACILGGDNIGVFSASDGLHVHRDPLGWLRCHRQGVVIVDPAKAAISLRDHGPFIAEDVKHGRELEKLLSFRPTIVVPASQTKVAA